MPQHVSRLSLFLDAGPHPAPVPNPLTPGYSGLLSLLPIRDELVLAARFQNALMAARPAGEPPLFFFHSNTSKKPTQNHAPIRIVNPDAAAMARIARSMEKEYRSWMGLPQRLPALYTRLISSSTDRRIARSLPGFTELLAALSTANGECRRILRLLAVADDEVVLAIHPALCAGVRILLNGVADVHHLHVLIAAAISGDPEDDLLPGVRPDPRVVAAYRGYPPSQSTLAAEAIFQLYRLSALRPDGTLPTGFAGSDHWIAGESPPTQIPAERGERVILLGEPAFPAAWDVEPMFPGLASTSERIEVLPRPVVEEWMAAHCPQWRKPAARLAAA